MFLFEQPPSDVLEKNREVLGITPETIKRDVAYLKEWMSKQSHLPEVTDDRVFERFLTHCKNSIERTKMKLDAYYSVRTAVPEFFQDRDPENPVIKASVEAVMYCVLPKTTPEGDRVTILKLFDADPSKYYPVTVFKVAIMLTDANVAEDLCRRHILVYDMNGATMAHAAALTIPILKKFLTSGSFAMPQRFSGFHILNAPSFFEALITLGKSFIKAKLAQRCSIVYEQPDENQRAQIYQELGMTELSIGRDVTHLREWMCKQPHLPDVTDETFLERFLVHCKNNLEKTKQKLDLYFTVRGVEKDYFANRNPFDPKIKQAINVLTYVALPRITPDSYRVTILRLFDPDVSKLDLFMSAKAGLMLLDAHMTEDFCKGHIIIFDLKGFTLAHASKITFPFLKKYDICGAKSFPQRFGSIHVINVAPFMEKIITLAKGMLKEKLKQRIHIYAENYNKLYDYVPKYVLPKEYGGTYPFSMEDIRDTCYESLVKHNKWFEWQKGLYSDESKRIGTSLTYGDLFGMEGSFRAIQID